MSKWGSCNMNGQMSCEGELAIPFSSLSSLRSDMCTLFICSPLLRILPLRFLVPMFNLVCPSFSAFFRFVWKGPEGRTTLDMDKLPPFEELFTAKLEPKVDPKTIKDEMYY